MSNFKHGLRTVKLAVGALQPASVWFLEQSGSRSHDGAISGKPYCQRLLTFRCSCLWRSVSEINQAASVLQVSSSTLLSILSTSLALHVSAHCFSTSQFANKSVLGQLNALCPHVVFLFPIRLQIFIFVRQFREKGAPVVPLFSSTQLITSIFIFSQKYEICHHHLANRTAAGRRFHSNWHHIAEQCLQMTCPRYVCGSRMYQGKR